MDNCIFCKIFKGDIDAAKFWEDENFFAILDLNPSTKGMSLVLPKQHFDSYIFDMPDESYQGLLAASKKVAKLLEKTLRVQKVALVMEGMGVNHAHVKLYPMYGLEDSSRETWGQFTASFEKYPGYITTVLGPKSDVEYLKTLAKEIRSKA